MQGQKQCKICKQQVDQEHQSFVQTKPAQRKKNSLSAVHLFRICKCLQTSLNKRLPYWRPWSECIETGTPNLQITSSTINFATVCAFMIGTRLPRCICWSNQTPSICNDSPFSVTAWELSKDICCYPLHWVTNLQRLHRTSFCLEWSLSFPTCT